MKKEGEQDTKLPQVLRANGLVFQVDSQGHIITFLGDLGHAEHCIETGMAMHELLETTQEILDELADSQQDTQAAFAGL